MTTDTALAPPCLNATASEIFQNSGWKKAGKILAIIKMVKLGEKAESRFESIKTPKTRHNKNLRLILEVRAVINGDDTATVIAKALNNHPAVSTETPNSLLIVGKMPITPNSVVIMPKAPNASIYIDLFIYLNISMFIGKLLLISCVSTLNPLTNLGRRCTH